MTEQKPVKRNPLFSSAAMACLLVSGLLLLRVINRVGQGDNLSGYSGFSVSVSFLVALALSGLVTGQIGLIRGEKPVALPILALFLNGVIFISAILIVPR